MLLNHLKVKVGYYFERLHPYMPHHCLGVKERRWDLTPGILDMVCQESAEDSTTSQVTFPYLLPTGDCPVPGLQAGPGGDGPSPDQR